MMVFSTDWLPRVLSSPCCFSSSAGTIIVVSETVWNDTLMRRAKNPSTSQLSSPPTRMVERMSVSRRGIWGSRNTLRSAVHYCICTRRKGHYGETRSDALVRGTKLRLARNVFKAAARYHNNSTKIEGVRKNTPTWLRSDKYVITEVGNLWRTLSWMLGSLRMRVGAYPYINIIQIFLGGEYFKIETARSRPGFPVEQNQKNSNLSLNVPRVQMRLALGKSK